ncbi:hypothetical protein M427DRAFT_126202, partial [Gonapodya prolifera JEL478]
MKTQKIRYKLPRTRYFTMDFPETVSLSAGMSWNAQITFRPLAKESYSDVVTLHSNFGVLSIPITACLPEHNLSFPATVDFGICPVNETTSKYLILKNSGEMATAFEWDTGDPFSIVPSKGLLAPNETLSVNISFSPRLAHVLNAVAVCRFGETSERNSLRLAKYLKITAIGKFSHIGLVDGPQRCEFDDVFVGDTAKKELRLQNKSPVVANFKATMLVHHPQNVFALSNVEASLGPGKSKELTVHFAPNCPGITSSENFLISTVSGNNIELQCKGNSVGPKVRLSSSLVNFNDIPSGSSVARSIHVINTSNHTASYQFMIDPTSTFKLDKASGVLAPSSSIPVTIRFCPFEPINYHRRVFCLIEHQEPLLLDLIGTCFTDKRRPATFTANHLEKYRNRLRNGVWQFGPEQMEEMLENGELTLRDGSIAFREDLQPDLKKSSVALGETLIMEQFFNRGSTAFKEVTLLDDEIDFGSSPTYRVAETRLVKIRNNTRGKVSCVWISESDESNSEVDGTFTVAPHSCDIKPLSTAEFRVSFRPNSENTFYHKELECFVYFKSMRNFRLVNEDTFTPSWCLILSLSGSTCRLGETTYIPNVSFTPANIEFPSCNPPRAVYRTVRMTNDGDSLVRFSFSNERSEKHTSESGSIFSVKPATNVLNRSASQLFIVRFAPIEHRLYKDMIKCAFNNTISGESVSSATFDRSLESIVVSGNGALPRLVLENEGFLLFRPTCVGAESKRAFTMHNISKVDVLFQWKIANQYMSTLDIEPQCGHFFPNEVISFVCSFRPLNASKHVMKVACLFGENHKGTGELGRMTPLTIVGQGAIGMLSTEPALIEFGDVLVHSIAESSLRISNPSDCDVRYTLFARKWQTDLDCLPTKPEDTMRVDQNRDCYPDDSADTSDLKLSPSHNVIAAHGTHTIKVQLLVQSCKTSRFTIYQRFSDLPGRAQALCDIVAHGVYPLLQITDIRAAGETKSSLWRAFNLVALNEDLEEMKGRHLSSFHNRVIAFCRICLILVPNWLGEQISPRELNTTRSAPITQSINTRQPAVSVTVCFKNRGVVPVDWAIVFPNDLESDVEDWAKQNDCAEEQLNHNFITENQIFSVTPKTGTLLPDQTCHVEMTYAHAISGAHHLSVTLKIKNGPPPLGKECLLHFSGVTVKQEEPYLHLSAQDHLLRSVALSCISPPKQVISLTNKGSAPVGFRVATEALEEIKRKNYGAPIFECHSPSGTVKPFTSVDLEWSFRPLEPREYSAQIELKLDTGGSKTIILRSRGDEQPLPLHDDKIPVAQELILQSQCAKLSKERLDFGHVLVGGLLRDIVCVQNIAESNGIFFRWHTSDFIDIEPRTGTLSPGAKQICRVIFVSPKYSKVNQIDVVCEIENTEEMLAYEKHLREVEHVRRERRGSSSSLDLAGSRDLRVARYSPLPPINYAAAVQIGTKTTHGNVDHQP